MQEMHANDIAPVPQRVGQNVQVIQSWKQTQGDDGVWYIDYGPSLRWDEFDREWKRLADRVCGISDLMRG